MFLLYGDLLEVESLLRGREAHCYPLPHPHRTSRPTAGPHARHESYLSHDNRITNYPRDTISGGWVGSILTTQPGDIKLPPEQLTCLFTVATPQADKFRQNIRQYNAALALASLGVEVDKSVNEDGGGPPTFRIRSELCHRLQWFPPSTSRRPSRIRIYDACEALERRMQHNVTLDPITTGCLRVSSSHTTAGLTYQSMPRR